MRPKTEIDGLKLTCECGQVHYIRSGGKRQGNWDCLMCGGTINWKIKTKAEMLVPPQKERDVMDLFSKR